MLRKIGKTFDKRVKEVKRKFKKSNNMEDVKNESQDTAQAVENQEEITVEATEEVQAEVEQESETDKLKQEVATLNDKYLRLSAEFDNYRKRTLKERMDLIKTAGEDILLNILPVIDNFERALKSMENAQEVAPIKEGVDLIYTNFKNFLNQKGVKEIEAVNTVFDTDVHEAITKIPAPSEDLKGKVVDVIEKGYTLNEKVIRFSKVVVGE